MKKLAIGFGALVAVLALQGVSNAAAGKAYDLGQKGPYEVGFTSFVLTDTSRPGDGGVWTNRPIPVYVWYPVDPGTITPSTPEATYPLDPLYSMVPNSTSSDWEAHGMDRAYQGPVSSSTGPFPLLMFSPGWGAPAFMHTSVGTRLASHGFVVAVLYHYGDQWWPWEPPFDHIALAMMNRPRDLSFAMTDLLQKNATASHLLYRTIAPEHVAAAGWSLGGYAAMTLAGGDDDVCDYVETDPYGYLDPPPPPEACVASSVDPRVKAIVPLDGSNQMLKFDELARVRVPAMGMGEEWNMLALNLPEMASWQARQHAAFSSHPAYRVDVYNTNHQSFSDACDGIAVLGDLGIFDAATVTWFSEMLSCGLVTPSAQVHPLVGKYMVAFLRTHLLAESGHQHILTPGWALTREPLVEFFVTEKRNPHAIDEEWPGTFTYFMHQPGSQQARAEKDPKHRLPVHRIAAPR
jgi:dienelactone hydrolase